MPENKRKANNNFKKVKIVTQNTNKMTLNPFFIIKSMFTEVYTTP